MHRIIIILCLLLHLFPGMAQITLPEELDTPRKRADRLTIEMKEELGLFPYQIDIIDSLNYTYALEVQRQVLDKDLSLWGQYREGNKIMSRKEDELKKIFTPEQYKKYEKWKSEVRWKIIEQMF